MSALLVGLIALLLLPLVQESVFPPRDVPGAVLILRGADFCYGCTEDAPFGTFLWLEATVAVVALFAALALSFRTSRWASVGRVLAGSLAATALALLPATLRQTGGLNYTSVRWGYQVALSASLVALVATVVAAFGRLSSTDRSSPARP